MKKICILIIMSIFLTGCDVKNSDSSNKKTDDRNIKVAEKEIEVNKEVEEYIDNNDIKFSIYRYINYQYSKTKDYSDYWVNNQDISYYTFFYSQEDIVNSNYFKNDFINYKMKFKTINAKHGLNLQFTTSDGKINKTILKPDDVWDIFPYVQIYLYDDLFNAGKSWYSHTEQNQVNPDTLYTTFKITMGDPSRILSDIKVTAFTYDSEDDFKDNQYRGNSYYQFILGKL